MSVSRNILFKKSKNLKNLKICVQTEIITPSTKPAPPPVFSISVNITMNFAIKNIAIFLLIYSQPLSHYILSKHFLNLSEFSLFPFLLLSLSSNHYISPQLLQPTNKLSFSITLLWTFLFYADGVNFLRSKIAHSLPSYFNSYDSLSFKT